MNLGRYVFAQVVDFVPRYLFNKIVSKYKGDFHAKELNSHSQLLHLLFGQLTGCSSLHEICLCLLARSDILYHLGIRKTVRISSLARANEKRDYHIFEESGLNLIQSVRPLYAKTAITDVCVENVLYALDSTTISTSIKLAAWALGKYSKGAVKMHALLDLRGSIPAQIHISDGKWHDSNMLELIFVTNNVDFPAIEIANIYRHRWYIEVFFKWIRQKHLHKASVGLLRKCG